MKRLWKTLLVGLVCAVAITAVVMARIPDAAGVIHGCYTGPGSNLYVIDSALSRCRAGDTPLNWSVQGPPGPAGPMGPSDAFLKNDQGTFGSQNLDSTVVDLETLSQLPAGSYVFNATLAFAGGTTFNAVQCFLRTSDNPPHYLSNFVQTSVGGVANSFGTMTLTGAATLAATTDVKASCIASGPVFTQPSSLIATRVATLTVQP